MAVQSSSNPLIHVEEAHANPSITISIFILPFSKPSHTHHYLFSLYTKTIPISYTSMHTLTPPTRSPFLPHAWLSKAPPIHPSMCMGLMQTISSPHPSSLFSYSHALNAHMPFLSLPVATFHPWSLYPWSLHSLLVPDFHHGYCSYRKWRSNQLEKTPSFLLQKDARTNRPDTSFEV